MNRLSTSLGRLGGHYDVVVVGSGYGGAITAARLAGATKEGSGTVRLAVLERGQEIPTGSFPQTLAQAVRRVQLRIRGQRFGPPAGLFDIRMDRDVAVVQGCGLGGTSLINANVVLEPSAEVRRTQEWPTALGLADPAWDRRFRDVRRRLNASPYPDPTVVNGGSKGDPRRWPRIRKLIALDKSARTSLHSEQDLEDDGSGLDGLGLEGSGVDGLVSLARRKAIPSPKTLQVAPQGHPPLSICVPEIAVTFRPRVSFGGVRQGPCTLCGDCVTGCNHGAKNTLPTNYLAAAKHRGAEIYCEVAVTRIDRIRIGSTEKWVISFEPLNTGRETYQPPDMWVTADVVVVAAGSLGSTELLLRSARRNGGSLDLSDRLGDRFSGNGDAIAFGYNCTDSVNGFGAGRHVTLEREATGPTITGLIDLRRPGRVQDQIIIQEGAIPGALATPARLLLTLLGWTRGLRTTKGWTHWVREVSRAVSGALLGGGRGALRNTQTYLVMAHDDMAPGERPGRLVLHDGKLRIVWPGAAGKQVFERIDSLLFRATRALSGIHLANPMWARGTRKRVVTVHPLGGCPMASSAADGVVDHRGAVFDAGAGEGAVHEGLYVNDGAVIPRSLGANPLLTISAIAERNAGLIAEERGWETHDNEFDEEPGESVVRPGLRFSERLQGWIEPSETAPFEVKRGRIEAVLTIESDDLWEMSRNGSHEAHIYGTLRWPCQHGREALSVTGTFQLFDPEPRRVEVRKMRYNLVLRGRTGEVYLLSGRKTIHDEAHTLDMGRDVTHVRFELYRADVDGERLGAAIATGHLRLQLREVWSLIRSVRVTHATSMWKDLGGRLRFGLFYLGGVIRQHGWLIRPSEVANPYGPHRPIPLLTKPTTICSAGEDPDRRFPRIEGHPMSRVVLRRCEEGTISVQAEDGAVVALTRFRKENGRRGPVILAPGFGTSTLAFRISTNDRFYYDRAGGGRDYREPEDPIKFVTGPKAGKQERRSFADDLMRRGYDVWLFDYRASELSGAAGTQFTLDDIARYDWPAAVEAVLRIRHAEDTAAGRPVTRSVQILGHCVGSLSLLMSILGGHLNRGVRSVICSQSLTHVDQPWLNRLKARLRLASVLRIVGGWPTHNPDYDTRSGRMSQLVDALFRLSIWERCRNPVCRRIQFLYGSVNLHEQLNARTHDAMHEMFNEANTRTFEHLSKIIRAERIVDAEGRNVYLTRETGPRMRLPVGLLQGEANPIFRPRGLEWTHEWLVSHANDGTRLPQGLGWSANGDTPGLFKKIVLRGTILDEDQPAPDRYGHMDCFIGRSCIDEVSPQVVAELERGDRIAAMLRSGGDLDAPWTIQSPLELC